MDMRFGVGISRVPAYCIGKSSSSALKQPAPHRENATPRSKPVHVVVVVFARHVTFLDTDFSLLCWLTPSILRDKACAIEMAVASCIIAALIALGVAYWMNRFNRSFP